MGETEILGPIGNAARPSWATVDQADIRALGGGMTAVRRGAASLQDLGCRHGPDP